MKLLNSLAAMIKKNSTLILSSTAVTGVVTTAYLAGKASFKAAQELDDIHARTTTDEHIRRDGLTHIELWRENTQIVWKLYIPTVVSGVFTIACIVGTTKVSNKRAMAAQAAFVLTERAYSEYRDKVIETHGEKADQKIRDSIAEDRIRAKPPSNEVVVVVGSVLCCELYTGRYFQSDMETLRKAQNDINAMVISQDQVSLEEWYYQIGLQPTQFSSDFGWTSDRKLDLEFTTVLSEDQRPCLAFNYRHLRPLYEGILEE